MTVLDKALRGSSLRIRRFHDRKNNLALRTAQDYVDALYAFCTAVLRVTFGYYPRLPMITLPAIRFLRKHLDAKARVLEWGSGMSTLWLERHCAEVHAVEDQYDWYCRIRARAKQATVYHLQGREYVSKIRDFPSGYFDLISIDGGHRLACLEATLEIGGASMLLLDDTDAPDLVPVVARLAGVSGWQAYRFAGFSPGQFFVKETTILMLARDDAGQREEPR